jgi:hypothetical protein
MRTVTPQFLAALTASHRPVFSVDVMAGVSVVVADLPISGGSVTVDAGSEVRYTCTVTVGDIGYLPKLATDALAPYGNLLRIKRGIRYTNGAVEWVPVGLFVIDDASGDRVLGPVTVAGKGLESLMRGNKLTVPYSTAGEIGHVTAITSLVAAVLPSVAVDSSGVTGDIAPARKTWDADSDRWAACRELATAIGAEVYFDAEGTLVVRDLPPAPPAAAPVWTVAAGPGGVLVGDDVALALSGVCNGVRCQSDGNATDGTAPVYADAVDTDPTSPTRWGGPIGKRLRIVKSPLYRTVGQCESAAAALLPRVLGPNRTIGLSSVPNPALEAGDCIRVVHLDGTPELHVVQSVTIPLSVDGDCAIATRSGVEEVP